MWEGLETIRTLLADCIRYCPGFHFTGVSVSQVWEGLETIRTLLADCIRYCPGFHFTGVSVSQVWEGLETIPTLSADCIRYCPGFHSIKCLVLWEAAIDDVLDCLTCFAVRDDLWSVMVMVVSPR